ncbi:LacI family DNA-binding transcriptional regulator [Rhodovastum atsumiense]|uniref:LacI family DNA-binding transcriptional regulator n=1 Tax=Rhodovastum atsumiense TaxID=504468 RepID=A0A5M6J2N4_9PROT|nr:LacI family DNA-binding transcriptional regulator [Rhodovastum atsumiense]KAA5613858.1 LacI family DNA-binding transcriptional regulator [Rhodovastum atsumiense]
MPDPSTPSPPRAVPPRRPARGGGAATLADVARVAGVAPVTVSRAINTPDALLPETLALVRQAIDKVGYVPNLLAGGLASSHSRLVAAIVPSIGTSMFAEAVEALSDRLSEAGYEVLLGISGFGQSREDELLNAVLSRRPDALFLIGTEHSASARRRLQGSGIPVVEAWELTEKPLDLVVGFSHTATGRAAAKYLLGKGYRRFAIIAASDRRAMLRRDGFLAELAGQGVGEVFQQPTAAPGTVRGGRAAFAAITEAGPLPEAVFCTVDPLAHGAMLEAQQRGLVVPRDVAVMGFGDFADSAWLQPALTTIHFDRRRIGGIAAEVILAELNGKRRADRVIDIGFEVAARESA